MKLFLDTADTELIEKHFQTDLIDGITTNPTLIMKSGRDPEEVYQQLIDMGIDDISMEVVGDFDEMYMEGLRLSSKFGKNATIKVPCTPAGLKVCKKLSRDLVNVNVTLIFSQQHKRYLQQRQVQSMFHLLLVELMIILLMVLI